MHVFYILIYCFDFQQHQSDIYAVSTSSISQKLNILNWEDWKTTVVLAVLPALPLLCSVKSIMAFDLDLLVHRLLSLETPKAKLGNAQHTHTHLFKLYNMFFGKYAPS